MSSTWDLIQSCTEAEDIFHEVLKLRPYTHGLTMAVFNDMRSAHRAEFQMKSVCMTVYLHVCVYAYRYHIHVYIYIHMSSFPFSRTQRTTRALFELKVGQQHLYDKSQTQELLWDLVELGRLDVSRTNL